MTINWPRIETGKPHMYWGGERWYTQCNSRTDPLLFGDALVWSWDRYVKGFRL